ncbi:Eukaryotic translation initiation factor 5A [Cryptotermes secundus]|uniref:Eukaryotic translation initiation factor 5A n=1 Tax=Cryptotermes secundus TaxID=105785 RepID=A0A2J7R627_9NEOP|nr:Eukaryotic translation initiation factor 5A [Cryptotermes secundus]
MSTSKTGKHGHAKVHLVGIDIFNAKKYEDICPSTHNMDVPFVKREDYQLTDISDDGYLCLMADNGDLREDLKVPDGELGAQLRADFEAGKELLVSAEMYSYFYFVSLLSLNSSATQNGKRSSTKWSDLTWLLLQEVMAVRYTRENGIISGSTIFSW